MGKKTIYVIIGSAALIMALIPNRIAAIVRKKKPFKND